MPKLGVNIDHVATLRQARRVIYPDPIEAARICEDAGCDSIVCHLREDRRHINDNDLVSLKKRVRTRLNLELSVAPDIVEIACKVKPDQATLVPEKREEVTTEGGLGLSSKKKELERVIKQLVKENIQVSLFIDPEEDIIKMSKDLGVGIIELHTGAYSNAKTSEEMNRQLGILKGSVRFGKSLGLIVNAGHGLNYQNVSSVAKIDGIEELNIGHSIISHAIFVGLEKAVKDMKALIK
ncbi:MAG: pyridoxine 5'-phosphate synthase [Candidatus Omnitrophica bacterium]|nr:pyridoxine 5'-phosphate synthase [Candidatus Omnitrophota bacterium]